MYDQSAPSLTHCQVCGMEFDKTKPRDMWDRLCSECSQKPPASNASVKDVMTERPVKNDVLGTNPKDLLGQKKVDLSLVPPASIIYQALAMEDGARKYGPYNWRESKVRARVYVAAAMRHILDYLDGNELTSDTKVPNLGAALACLGIMADAKETGNLVDDRPAKGVAGELIDRLKAEKEKKS